MRYRWNLLLSCSTITRPKDRDHLQSRMKGTTVSLPEKERLSSTTRSKVIIKLRKIKSSQVITTNNKMNLRESTSLDTVNLRRRSLKRTFTSLTRVRLTQGIANRLVLLTSNIGSLMELNLEESLFTKVISQLLRREKRTLDSSNQDPPINLKETNKVRLMKFCRASTHKSLNSTLS